jgi:serine/threonine protein kinase
MGLDGSVSQRSPEDLLGTVLGTCTLERVLGRGGMGVVYLAQQSRPRRQVAVKVLMLSWLPDSHRRERFLQRFRREADAVAALEHPNILPIFEYGEQEDLAYLVMPYVSGGTLRDRVLRKGPLPLLEAAGFIAQAAAALEYAHAHGVIHRDVKPQNMLLYPDKRLVLSDFGIAKLAQAAAEEEGAKPSDLTTLGRVVGTPDYMAPEQALGKTVDARSDIYSLGVVLFYLVTGRLPFVAPQSMTVVAKHVSEPPPSPRQFRPDLPVAAENVILRALAKDPDERYRTASDLSRTFRATLPSVTVPVEQAGRRPTAAATPVVPSPVVPPPAGSRKTERPPERTPAVAKPGTPAPKPPRRPWLIALIALLIVGLAAGGVYAVVNGAKQNKPPVVATRTTSPTARPSFTPTNTASPTATDTPTATATPPPTTYQAEQLSPQNSDLPTGEVIASTTTTTTPADFDQANPGRVVKPTSGFNWVKDILTTIDQNGSQYLVVGVDQFATASDAHNYFMVVTGHLVSAQPFQAGDEGTEGLCCDITPNATNIFYREKNVTVLMLVDASGQQAIQDGEALAKKLDQHVRSALATPGPAFPALALLPSSAQAARAASRRSGALVRRA